MTRHAKIYQKNILREIRNNKINKLDEADDDINKKIKDKEDIILNDEVNNIKNEMKEIRKQRFIAPKEEINTGIKNYNEDIDVEFLKKKRKAKSLEFYYDKDFNDKNMMDNDFMEEEDMDLGSDLDKSGISSSSELNDELVFGKNYLGEKM